MTKGKAIPIAFSPLNGTPKIRSAIAIDATMTTAAIRSLLVISL
ncbi:hypothetical protein PPHE_a0054 [Pseudoalteromonas phenolica O-BC30]|nr:hypothetical protein [Pseudoalteromonas phenolica O-BC30]